MIVTVTLNPSLDQTLEVDSLVQGGINKTEPARLDPGGKGVDVARALVTNGVLAVAVLPVGAANGEVLLRLLSEQSVTADAVQIAGTTRANVTIIEHDGTTTKLNEPGPTLTADEVGAVMDAVTRHATPGGWIVAGGSLTPGLEGEVYGLLAQIAAESGARLAVDTSGPALTAALQYRPHLIKPNAAELSEADSVWFAQGPTVTVVNTVGAGDAMLAGALFVGGRGPAALRSGIAWATAAVATTGTGVPVRDAVAADSIHLTSDPDPSHPLTEEKQ